MRMARWDRPAQVPSARAAGPRRWGMGDVKVAGDPPPRLLRTVERHRLEKQLLSEVYECLVAIHRPGETGPDRDSVGRPRTPRRRATPVGPRPEGAATRPRPGCP